MIKINKENVLTDGEKSSNIKYTYTRISILHVYM